MTQPIIAVDRVSKQVRDADGMLTILHEIDFELEARQSAAIVGASGSGKSTLLAIIAGLDTPSAGTVKLDGVDLMPYFSGKTTGAPHEALYWRFGQQMAIRYGNYKLVKAAGNDRPELYDLAADIGETKDLSSAKPDIYKDLQTRYDAWNKTLVEPRWGPPNAAAKAAKNQGKKAKAAAKTGN